MIATPATSWSWRVDRRCRSSQALRHQNGLDFSASHNGEFVVGGELQVLRDGLAQPGRAIHSQRSAYFVDAVHNILVQSQDDCSFGFLLRSEERRVGKECRS